MAIKKAFHNENLPDFSNAFSWGVKISNFNEIFLVTGHADCDPNFITQTPGDPVAQTRLILAQMKQFIEKSGFTLNEVVRTDWTFVNEVSSDDFSAIASLWEEYLIDVKVKPATGTLRYVHRLGMPDMMVEYEMMLAR